MAIKIWGVLNHKNEHIDISFSEKGVKQYATLNGYNKISLRSEYYVIKIMEKIKNKWVEIPNN